MPSRSLYTVHILYRDAIACATCSVMQHVVRTITAGIKVPLITVIELDTIQPGICADGRHSQLLPEGHIAASYTIAAIDKLKSKLTVVYMDYHGSCSPAAST